MGVHKHNTVEFGDFQTPKPLAECVIGVLESRGLSPKSIIEPTCGMGVFLEASLERFPNAEKAIGVEIHPEYFRIAHDRIRTLKHSANLDVKQADFFHFDWKNVFQNLPEPILVVGNPPWVTASQLAAMQSKNLPKKSNFQNQRGFDAISGKSNFDIAEWMLIHLIEWMTERHGTVAMLLKQSVARKVLSHVWKQSIGLADASMYCFDARKHFNVSVDACLLVCDLRPGSTATTCEVYNLENHPGHVEYTIGFRQSMLLANMEAFETHVALLQDSHEKSPYIWRSGVKHDCAKIMELKQAEGGFANGLGEHVDIEDSCVYPMVKGAGVANGKKTKANRYMLVTQRATGEVTHHLKNDAPRTWAYLERHGEVLDSRGSSIYRNRPRFSIFGIGEYTFAPWKVAICGLYKKLQFSVVGPKEHKPVVFDDTVYFLSCKSKREAELIQECLRSSRAREFFSSFIFWDAKRPITAEILSRLNLIELIDMLGRLDELATLRPDISLGEKAGMAAGRLF